MAKLILRKEYSNETKFIQVSENEAKEDFIKSFRRGCDEYIEDDAADASFASQIINNTKWFKTEKFSYIVVDLDEIYTTENKK